MRVALLIVALALITSCFVSGTYAKYITSAKGDETARVAKFGVLIEASGDLFGTTYKATTDDTPGASGDAASTLTVVSSNTDKVVAPGTKNDDGLKFAVTGTPEVDVAVTMTLESNYKEVFLKAGTWADMTTSDDKTDTFTLGSDYYPVVFTLKIGDNTYTGNLADIETALATTAATYKAGTNLATAIGNIQLTWAWAYGNANTPANGNDFADTLLGDLAAGAPTILPEANAPSASNYNLETRVSISINVFQVD
jgi:hypothetical protein